MNVAADAGQQANLPSPGLDAALLETYLRARIEDFGRLLDVRKFAGGQSNPTFLLTTSSTRYVLRKKPPGKLVESAHAIDREYRVLAALEPVGVPVPSPRLYCDDTDIVGTPFYLMDHLDGRIFRDPRLPELPAETRAAVYREMGDVLARLHAVDPSGAGLDGFGRMGGYAERQLRRWSGQYRNTGIDDIEAMDFLIEWLPRHLPTSAHTTIAHGDYRLENLVFHPEESRIIGILDWELSTLGDPLADLAYNCMVYHMAIPMQPGFEGMVPDGIPSESEYVAHYCANTGRTITEADWRFYMAFSLFRLAAISAGIYMRGKSGSASSANAHEFREHARTIAEAGMRAARGG